MDLSSDQKIDVKLDRDLQICGYPKFDVLEYALNNNYSIPDYPNAKSPTNKLEVRQAIAYLVNKTYILTDILHDEAFIIDQPFSAPQSSWCNNSVVGSNYPYPYNPNMAVQLLATLGFNDTDGNGWLNYLTDWPGIAGADTTMYTLKVVIRIDHEARLLTGRYLVSQLEDTLASTPWPEGYVGGGFKCL